MFFYFVSLPPKNNKFKDYERRKKDKFLYRVSSGPEFF